MTRRSRNTTSLPNAAFMGFTGTPLLKADKQKSIEVFGRYIHTYKFDQAVRESLQQGLVASAVALAFVSPPTRRVDTVRAHD